MSGSNFQNLVFPEIPGTLRVPGAYVQVRPNYSLAGLFDFPAKALLIGQMLASGSATPGQVYRLFTAAQAMDLFGQGSIAHRMAVLFLAANPWVPVDIVALADPAGGAQASGTLTVATAATQSGTVILNICGQDVPVTINAATVTTPAATATAIAAAINAVPNLPCTASAVGAAVTLTARHKGAQSNDLVFSAPSWPASGVPAGLTITTTGNFSGGAGLPMVGTVIAAIATTWYTDISMAWTDSTNLATLSAELDSRYTAMTQMDGVAYVAPQAAYGSLPGMVDTINGKCIAAMGLTASLSPSWEWAASLCGAASYATLNDPARQLQDVTLPGIVPPLAPNWFTRQEQDALLHEGLATYNVRRDGTVAIQRLISTYLATSEGFADSAWLDVNTIKVMTRVRYDWRAYVQSVWPSAKLTDDGSLAAEYDSTIATPSRLKASWIARSQLYEKYGWLESTASLGQAAVFERDPSDPNKVLARLPVRVVGNLIVLAASLEFQA